MPSVLVLDKTQDPLTLGGQDPVGVRHVVFLCWLAPETLSALETSETLEFQCEVQCHSFQEVIGSLASWESCAMDLARSVSQRGPRHHDLPLRLVIEEQLFREALEVEVVRRAAALCGKLTGGRPQDCELRLDHHRQRLFRRLPGWTDVTIGTNVIGTDVIGTDVIGTDVIGADVGEHTERQRPSLPRRLARRLRGAMLSGDLRRQMGMLFDQLDAGYRLRTGIAKRLPMRTPEPGSTTVFSSYINNSRILAAIEPLLPGPVHWLLNHRRQGTAGARGDQLWRFAPPEFSKIYDETTTPDPDLSPTVAAWLESSPIWQRYWLRHGPHALSRLTACWEHYLDTVSPQLVVMANQHGLEGWFCRLAQLRGIPVLQAQHGVLGGAYYTGEPVLSDTLLVWGEFWRRLWPVEERKRIHTVAPGPVVARVERPRRPKRRLTWFSWPFAELPFFHSTELPHLFLDLLHGLLETGTCEVTLRAHPLENLADLADLWRRRYGALPPELELSQWEPLGDILERTDIALMFRSTVMLDCFASGIPVVIPGWIEFDWQEELTRLEGVHLARHMDDLRATLIAWLEGPPTLDREQVRRFVLPEDATATEAARRLIRRLVAEAPTEAPTEAPGEAAHEP